MSNDALPQKWSSCRVLEEAGGKGRRAAYPRRVAPSRDEQQGAAHAAYMARMAAHFAEVRSRSTYLPKETHLSLARMLCWQALCMCRRTWRGTC